MKNRKLILILSLVLALTMSLGGTLAYLTDTDGEVNVMTVGNVIIDLIEQQRNADGNALEDYEQGKPMIPIVGSAQGEKDEFGQPTAANYVDKIVSVKNTGRSDAWVRVLVAVPANLESDDTTEADGPLHWNWGNRVDLNGTGAYNNVTVTESVESWNWEVSDAESITIGEVAYNVYAFYYKTKLPAGAQTSAAIAGMYMDSGVDYDADNGYYTFNKAKIDNFNGTVVIPVLAQAVQADGFDTYEAAFKAAFPYTSTEEGAATNGELQSWFNEGEIAEKVPTMVTVENDEQLNKAIADGADIIYLKAGNYGVIDIDAKRDLTIEAVAGHDVKIAGIDCQSNANHSNMIIKGVTIDNSKQTEGWYTGTSQNMMPCVGLWGGNFTFEDCTFYTTGESKKETAVMSWWTTEAGKSELNFKNCTFNGGNGSARAMQIYGWYDLNVEDCTFNTEKDYSLKYVGSEGCKAVLTNNKVYNTKNFVQLGSSVSSYAGNDYSITFVNNTLGEGINHVYIENAENQTIVINGETKPATDEATY